MKKYTLELRSASHGIMRLELMRLSSEGSDDEEVMQEKKPVGYVYSDDLYVMTIINQYYEKVFIQDSFINTDRLSFADFKKETAIFRDSFGIIRLFFRIDDEEYATEQLSVKMKESAINQNILNMVNYIYCSCGEYLSGELHGKAGSSPDYKLSLLREAVNVYGCCYGYFAAQASKHSSAVEKEAEFGRLDAISPAAVSYIAAHPERLIPVSHRTGIVYQNRYYQPTTAVIRAEQHSYDTYENRAVIGFLQTLTAELEQLIAGIRREIEGREFSARSDGYIDSKVYVYTNILRRLRQELRSAEEIRDKLSVMYHRYSVLFGIEGRRLCGLPIMTDIFRSSGSYMMIFRLMAKWFSEGETHLSESRLMMSFDSTSRIYEYYCLMKLIRALCDIGFTLEREYVFDYCEHLDYKNTGYNNTFVFSDGQSRVTLYYQPQITNSLNTEGKNGIELFRSTSFSLSNGIDYIHRNIKKGSYYTPDFIIKTEKPRCTEYYILDAKHKKKDDVIRDELNGLVFKYLFSVDVINEGERIGGLCILNGKANENSWEDIHDVSAGAGRKLSPHTYIITLSGNDTAENKVLLDYVREITDTRGERS